MHLLSVFFLTKRTQFAPCFQQGLTGKPSLLRAAPERHCLTPPVRAGIQPMDSTQFDTFESSTCGQQIRKTNPIPLWDRRSCRLSLPWRPESRQTTTPPVPRSMDVFYGRNEPNSHQHHDAQTPLFATEHELPKADTPHPILPLTGLQTNRL